jgi:membrane dipeptidase
MSTETAPLRTPVFDSHLDLAWNAQVGRDLTLPLSELRAQNPLSGQTACVSFSELRRAGVAACFGTLFACPAMSAYPQGYDPLSPDGWKNARSQAIAQLDQYRRWQDQGHIRLLGSGEELRAHLAGGTAAEERLLGVMLLMEGADPLETADDLAFWRTAGVRLIGPAWGHTRYAGGTDAPGPLTALGQELLIAMREQGVALDASHLDDASFEMATAIQPLVIASHSNSRELVPGNRQLSPEMAQVIVQAGGVIGLVSPSRFIRPGWHPGEERATFADWARHGQIFGWNHVGLGSDMDGGFGVEEAPAGLEIYSDLLTLLDEVPSGLRAGVRGDHWIQWVSQHL